VLAKGEAEVLLSSSFTSDPLVPSSGTGVIDDDSAQREAGRRLTVMANGHHRARVLGSSPASVHGYERGVRRRVSVIKLIYRDRLAGWLMVEVHGKITDIAGRQLTGVADGFEAVLGLAWTVTAYSVGCGREVWET
jgi:hypothetical protein